MIPNKKIGRGMVQDYAPIDIPQGSIRLARNMYLNSVKNSLSNELGFKEELPVSKNIIGSISIEKDNFVLFSKDEDLSEIGIYENNTYRVVIRSPFLNFSEKEDFKGVFVRNFDKELIVIFIDNINPPRLINLDNLPVQLSPDFIQASGEETVLLNLFPEFKHPIISLDKVNNYGSLNSGVYRLGLAYVLEDNTLTNFSFISNPVSIIEDDLDQDIYAIEGNQGGIPSGKSVKWNVFNLDNRYKKVVFCVISTNEGVLEVKLLPEKEIENLSSFTYLGTELTETVDISEIIIKNQKYDKAKTITQLDNRLFLGNVSTNDSIDYQKYANNIKFTWSAEAVDLIHPSNSHKDPKKIDQTRGFMWDEVYAFYISFLMKDGTMSKDFHIPGREMSTGNVLIGTVVGEENSPLMDFNPGQNEHLKNDISIDSEVRYFHTRETASRFNPDEGSMGFWENENEYYPNDEDWGDLAGKKVRHHKFPSFELYKRNEDFYEDPNYYDISVTQSKGFIKDKDRFPLLQAMTSSWTLASNKYNLSNDFKNCSRESLSNPFNVILNSSNAKVSYNPQNSTFTAIEDCDFNLDIDLFISATCYAKQKDNSNPCNPLYPGINEVTVYFKISKIDINNNENIIFEKTEYDEDTNSDNFETLYKEIEYSNLLNVSLESGEKIIITAYTNAKAKDTGYIPGITVDANLDSYAQVNYEFKIEGYTTDYLSGPIIEGIRTMPILGVNARNIEIPEDIASKVDGYVIKYAKRTLGNMQVIGWSGMFHNQNYHPVYTDYQGAGAGTAIISANVDSSNNIYFKDDTLRFHAFDMMYDRYQVKPTHLKLNSVVKTNAQDIQQIDIESDYGSSDAQAAQRISSSTKVQTHFRADFIKEEVEDFDFINDENILRKVNGGRYVDADSYVGNLGAEEPLANMFSESIYHANIVHHTNPDASQSSLYSWTPYNESFTTNFDHAAQNELNLKIALCSLYSFKKDVYLNFYEQETVATNKINEINSSGIYESKDIYGGDIFVGSYGLRLTSGVRMEQTGNYLSPSASNKFEATKVVYNFPVYSVNNVNYRYSGVTEKEDFYPHVGRDYTDYKSWVKRSVDQENDNYFYYNSDYTLTNDLNSSYGTYNSFSKELNDFPYRVVRSKSYQPEDNEFSLRLFGSADYYEMPKDKGTIQNLENLSSSLIIHHEYSIFRTISKEQLSIESIEVTLGTGDIFRNPPQELLPTESGYAGLQHSSSAKLTKAGYFFVDSNQGKVFLLTDRIQEISNQGMRNWFRENLQFNINDLSYLADVDQNAAWLGGFNVAFDERENRIILTKKDYKAKAEYLTGRKGDKFDYINGDLIVEDESSSVIITNENISSYFDERSWTISFDVDEQMWISYHDYYPNHFISTRNNVYSYNKNWNYIYKHNEENVYGIYYDQNKAYRSFVDLVDNDNQPYSKVYSSIQWTTESIDSYLNYNYKNTFTQAMLYNSHQCSGEISLEHLSNMRYIEGSWSFNAFRDMVSDRNFPFLDEDYNLIDENIDSNKIWTDQKRFTDKYLIFRLFYDNCVQNSLYLYNYGSRKRLSPR